MTSALITPAFDRASVLDRHRYLSADIPQGLHIQRALLNWVIAWDHLIGQGPQQFYETICRDIDGDVSAFVDFTGTTQARLELQIKRNHRFVFGGEITFCNDSLGKTLHIQEWAVQDIDSRYSGIGLTLFRNLMMMVYRAQFDQITLCAGKEDGKYFWARRGFYVADDDNRGYLALNVKENLTKYSDTIPAETIKNIHFLLTLCDLDLGCQIASLPGMIQGKPLGWALMQGDNIDYVLNLADSVQMTRAKSSLRNLTFG